MTLEELRKKFINFFVERGHKEMPPSSLVPENDPSVLFTTAGMQQFKRYYTSPEEAPAKNVVTCQPCLRTSDIELVGDETHLTFFEMLGNFSFGGYFKKEAIEMAWEFLTDEKTGLGIKPQRISATYFDNSKAIEHRLVDTDKESYEVLKTIKDLQKIEGEGDDNFWSLGTIGSPGGPTVEFYVDGIEVWNLVFNEEIWEGTHWHGLGLKSVDTGMGLERMLVVLNNLEDIYETDVFTQIIKKIEEISGKRYQENQKLFRILTDHIRAIVFIIIDKERVLPSNKGQGSVLRKLIRDSEDIVTDLNFKDTLFIHKLTKYLVDIYQDEFPELRDRWKYIYQVLMDELTMHEVRKGALLPKINKRIKILERYLKNKLDLREDADNKWLKAAFIDPLKDSTSIAAGKFAYHLWNTNRSSKEHFWDQLDLELKKSIDREKFEEGYKEGEIAFKNISRAGVSGFKGGLVGESEITTQMHTATHLLLKALQEVLGSDVHQRGSNINEERIRFDFSYPKPMTDEEIKKVKDIVNQKIAEDIPVARKETTVEEAKKLGAEAQFINKYGDKVTLYSIGDYSHELCGGPHVERTGEIGKFKIKKEESSSAGVRRIRAVLE